MYAKDFAHVTETAIGFFWGFTREDIDRYVEAWSQPNAATATIDYYRGVLRQPPRRAETRLRQVDAPTLVIWGDRLYGVNSQPALTTVPRSLGAELAEPDPSDV